MRLIKVMTKIYTREKKFIIIYIDYTKRLLIIKQLQNLVKSVSENRLKNGSKQGQKSADYM